MPKVKDIAAAIEEFAPRELQEGYDNAGLQVGDPEMEVSAVLVCLDVTEDTIAEAIERKCNLIVSHHPLLFKGLKNICGRTPVERIASKAIKNDIAIYSAHTNLDSAVDGISYRIAHLLGLKNLRVILPTAPESHTGLGIIGEISPMPKMEFLRKVKEKFSVKALRYSAQSGKLVLRKIAVCGGSGGSLIPQAMEAGADAFVTADLKYHDFTDWGPELLLADIGHYESELCSEKILIRVITDRYGDFTVMQSETGSNPINIL